MFHVYSKRNDLRSQKHTTIHIWIFFFSKPTPFYHRLSHCRILSFRSQFPFMFAIIDRQLNMSSWHCAHVPLVLAAGTKLYYIRLLAGLGLVLGGLPPAKSPTAHYKTYLHRFLQLFFPCLSVHISSLFTLCSIFFCFWVYPFSSLIVFSFFPLGKLRSFGTRWVCRQFLCWPSQGIWRFFFFMFWHFLFKNITVLEHLYCMCCRLFRGIKAA